MVIELNQVNIKVTSYNFMCYGPVMIQSVQWVFKFFWKICDIAIRMPINDTNNKLFSCTFNYF